MADFNTYVTKLLKAEGGYVNDPVDKGGETYRGITRKNWPNWAGWKTVDASKPLKTGAIIPSLENEVKKFYQSNYWLPLKATELKTQVIAELIVDWRINGGYSATEFQNAINTAGGKLVVDGEVGPITIKAANTVNQKKLYEAIIAARKADYDRIVKNNPSQQKFYAGWLNRLEYFKSPVVLGLGTVLVVGFGLLLLIDNKS